MPSHIHNLDRESILLMYLADELSVEDRAEVQQMLSSDRVLRQQHDELVAMMQLTSDAITSLDSKSPMPAPMSSSVRHVSRAMNQWHVDRMAAARPEPESLPPRRFGWAATIAAVAACILIGFFVMWSRVDDSKNATNLANSGWEAPDPHATDITLTEDQKQQQIAEATETFTPVVATDTDRDLSKAERDMKTLALCSGCDHHQRAGRFGNTMKLVRVILLSLFSIAVCASAEPTTAPSVHRHRNPHPLRQPLAIGHALRSIHTAIASRAWRSGSAHQSPRSVPWQCEHSESKSEPFR